MSSERPSHLYAAYGLTIASELPLPELSPGTGVPDVWFRSGAVPEELPDCAGQGICFQAAPGRALVKLGGLFRLLVRDGTEVVIDRSRDADDDTIRLFLLGTCLGLLLQQRGEMVLHASTVAKEGRAIALAGVSSAGKTTLAAALVERAGYTLVADEASLISKGTDDGPVVIPGAPTLLLWERALERLSLWTDELRPVRPGVAKYALPSADRFVAAPQRLTHVCVLKRWNRNEVALERLTGFARFRSFLDHTFKEPYLAGLGLARTRQAHCQALVPHVQVFSLSWSQRWSDLEEAQALIHEHVFQDHATPMKPSIQGPPVIPGARHAS